MPLDIKPKSGAKLDAPSRPTEREPIGPAVEPFVAPRGQTRLTSRDSGPIHKLDSRDQHDRTPLMLAVLANDSDRVAKLFKEYQNLNTNFDLLDVDEHGNNVFELADNPEMRRLLEKQIVGYCKTVHLDPVQKLAQLGSSEPQTLRSRQVSRETANVASEAETHIRELTEDMQAAARNGDLAGMTKAVEEGALFDKPDRFTGSTVIHALALSPTFNLEVATQAIHGYDSHGAQASFTTRDQHWLTALQRVAHSNRLDLVEMILSAVAFEDRPFNLYAQDPKGRTFMQLVRSEDKQRIADAVREFCRARNIEPEAALRRLDPGWSSERRS